MWTSLEKHHRLSDGVRRSGATPKTFRGYECLAAAGYGAEVASAGEEDEVADAPDPGADESGD
jgi:hypothetical protein